jgi:hypothetical protein
VADIADAELLRRVLRTIGKDRHRAPRWVHVADAFALGSTYAAQLCRRFGQDPGTQVGNPRRKDPRA